MCQEQRDGLYSNRTAIGMMILPNDYPREACDLPCISLQKANTYLGMCILCADIEKSLPSGLFFG